MSEELAKMLERQLSESRTELATVKAEARDRRIKSKKLAEENETLKKQADAGKSDLQKQIDALTAERDSWKSKAEAAPSEIQQENERLTGELRTIKHRGAFEKVAKEQNIRPDAIEAAWKLSGYEADSDTPDEGKIRSVVGDAVKANPFLAQPAGETLAAGPRGSQQPLRTSVDSGGRGAPVATSGVTRVRKSDMQDPKWILDPRNKAALAEAAKNGTLEVIDDAGPSGPIAGNPFANDVFQGR